MLLRSKIRAIQRDHPRAGRESLKQKVSAGFPRPCPWPWLGFRERFGRKILPPGAPDGQELPSGRLFKESGGRERETNPGQDERPTPEGSTPGFLLLGEGHLEAARQGRRFAQLGPETDLGAGRDPSFQGRGDNMLNLYAFPVV